MEIVILIVSSLTLLWGIVWGIYTWSKSSKDSRINNVVNRYHARIGKNSGLQGLILAGITGLESGEDMRTAIIAIEEMSSRIQIYSPKMLLDEISNDIVLLKFINLYKEKGVPSDNGQGNIQSILKEAMEV